MKTIKLPTTDLWSGIIIVSIILSAAFLTPDKQQNDRKNQHGKVLNAAAAKGKAPAKITVQNQVFFSVFEINKK